MNWTGRFSLKEKPHTWHYGIIAEHWAEFQNHRSNAEDVAHVQRLIREHGEPALDVGCGTGRILVPCLLSGMDVDGCDVSHDMLAHCRKLAERQGLSPTLYAQSMAELDLPQRYRTIFCVGSFGIGSTRMGDAAALRRFHDHLEPGGVLMFDMEMPYGDGAWHWPLWLQENRRHLDPDFWTPPTRDRASDGTEFVTRSRITDLDPLEQVLTMQMRVERWNGGELLGSEQRMLTQNLYFKNELELLLRQAGFRDISILGSHAGSEATAADGTLVFVASKDARSG